MNVPEIGGRLVAVPLGALAHRRKGKPMHPRGAVFDAVLERYGSAVPWGVPWLDEVATQPALVRLSRGAGLPAALPDLLGLGLRVPGPDRPIDVLLSTTGLGPAGRLLPVPRRDAAAIYTSIMAYRSDAGPLRIAALPDSVAVPSEPEALVDAVRRGLRFTLAAARGTAAWRTFARLTITTPVEPLDPDVGFDAVRNPPPGLVPDGPMARFRAPAYAAARRGRQTRAGGRRRAGSAAGRP